MNVIRQTYTGKDIVIKRRSLEALGIEPGDVVIIQMQSEAENAASSSEAQRKRDVLARFADAWSGANLTEFAQKRQEMWRQWTSLSL